MSAYKRPEMPGKLKLALARVRAADSAPSDEFLADIDECNSLSAFIGRAWPIIEPDTEYKSNWHIDLISEHLEAVTSGQILRLLINMPPRYMKSIAVSVMWPAWEWRRRPSLRYMFATYAQSLSEEHSRQRHLVVSSDWYRERWGSAYTLTSENVFTVRNDHQGAYLATSFTGTATGKGGNRVVIDDPHNPRKAESELERKSAVVAFNRTFSNRLNDKKKDAIVVVMQRLHQEDISARCLELGYTHLCLPAEAPAKTFVRFPSGGTLVREKDELLWPEREGPAEIAAIKNAMGPYGYAGQYQQTPAPAGGGIFTTFEIVGLEIHLMPRGSKWIRYWDKAGSEGKGDYSAGVLMCVTPSGEFYVCDVVKGQWSAANREKVMRDTATGDGIAVRIWLEQEPGSGGKDSAAYSAKLLAGFAVSLERATGDKESRARPLAAQAAIGNVKLLRGPWNKAFIEECQMFPNGSHDDQIDAASGAFNRLALEYRPQAGAATAPPKPPAIPQFGAPTVGGIPGAF
jgi:predicted phage terminase large subunit-like protein